MAAFQLLDINNFTGHIIRASFPHHQIWFYALYSVALRVYATARTVQFLAPIASWPLVQRGNHAQLPAINTTKVVYNIIHSQLLHVLALLHSIPTCSRRRVLAGLYATSKITGLHRSSSTGTVNSAAAGIVEMTT